VIEHGLWSVLNFLRWAMSYWFVVALGVALLWIAIYELHRSLTGRKINSKRCACAAGPIYFSTCENEQCRAETCAMCSPECAVCNASLCKACSKAHGNVCVACAAMHESAAVRPAATTAVAVSQ
jgi:hypothetical protein